MQQKSGASTMADMIGGTKPTVQSEFIQFDKFNALVIDDMGAMRHALSSQLEWMGITSVKGVSNAEEALRQIEIRQFDLILCDYNLNKASSGQHFLEYLRNENMLSAKTIFVMVTAEAEYAYVANAAEFAPDDYILKPCPEKKLRARLERLFDRRNFLMPALTAMDEKDYARVVSECDRLLAMESIDRWRMAALRLKAEAQHALHDVESMLATYRQALALHDNVPWVKIGFPAHSVCPAIWKRRSSRHARSSRAIRVMWRLMNCWPTSALNWATRKARTRWRHALPRYCPRQGVSGTRRSPPSCWASWMMRRSIPKRRSNSRPAPSPNSRVTFWHWRDRKSVV